MESIIPIFEKIIVILKDIKSVSNTEDTKTMEDKVRVFVGLEEIINNFPFQDAESPRSKELRNEYIQLKTSLGM